MKEIINAFFSLCEAITNFNYWGQANHELLVNIVGVGLTAVIAVGVYLKINRHARF